MGRNRQRITDFIEDGEQQWAEQNQEEVWLAEQSDADTDQESEQEHTA